MFLRLNRLAEIPPGVFYDEGAHGVNALRVLRGEHAVFFPQLSDGLEGLIAYAVALVTSLLGRTVLAIRLPTALASAGAVLATFWLGRSLFGGDESGRATPWRGLLVGGVGAALLAFSLGYTVIGRTVFRANFLPFLLCLCLVLLWEGWKPRVDGGGTWWQIVLAGVCLGLVPYTYIASRFVPILFLFFGLSFLLPLRADTRRRVRVELPRTGLFLGVSALVAAPILLYFALHPEHFFLRSRHLWVLDEGRSQGGQLGTLLENVWVHLQVFGFRGDPQWRHNIAGRPLLNPLEAIFFWFGVGMALLGWRRPAYRLLLLWLGVMLLPAMLARDDLVPHTLTHDRRRAGNLSSDRRWCLGSIAALAGAEQGLTAKHDLDGCRGHDLQCCSDARRPHLPYLLPQMGRGPPIFMGYTSRNWETRRAC